MARWLRACSKCSLRISRTVRIDFFLPFFTIAAGMFFPKMVRDYEQEDENILFRNELDTQSGNHKKVSR